MESRQRPRLHARDHMPGGADPIDFSGITLGSSALAGMAQTLFDLGATNLWKFDDATGTSAHDYLGGVDMPNEDGTIAWGQEAGPPGTASVLSTEARWAVPSSSIPALSNNFSAGLWIKTSAADSAQALMGQGQPLRDIGSAGVGWELATGLTGSKATLVVGNSFSSVAELDSDANLTEDEWTLIGFTVDSNEWTLYINGEAQADTASFTASTYVSADTFFGGDAGTAIIRYTGLFSFGFIAGATPFSADDWAALYRGAFPYAGDGQVLTADGTGSTQWRTVAGTGGIDVSFTDTEVVIDGSGVSGGGGSGGVFAAPAAEDDDTLDSGDAGLIYFNTTTLKLRLWNGTSWENVTTSASSPAHPPTITSFTPDTGSTGDTVTITGDHFTEATEVDFNGSPGTSLVITDDEHIDIDAPSGVSTGPLTVITPYGSVDSADDFTVLSPLAAYSAAVAADSPKHFWKLQGSSGTTGNNDDGSSSKPWNAGGGSPTYQSTGPMTGSDAVAFGSGSDYKARGDIADGYNQDNSVEFFFKANDLAADHNLYFCNQPGMNVQLKTTGHLYIGYPAGANDAGNSTFTASTGTWYHVVVTYKRSTGVTKLYINGVDDGTSFTNVAYNWSNGSGASCGGFNGSLSLMAMWDNVCLTSTQVAAHYAASGL